MGTDSPPSLTDASTIRGVFSVAKEILPYLMMLYSLIFGFGVKQSTSDRNQELLNQDHVQLQELRSDLAKVREQQVRITTTLEMLLKLNDRGNNAR